MKHDDLMKQFEPEIASAISCLVFAKLLGIMGGKPSDADAEARFKDKMLWICCKMKLQTLVKF